MKRYLAIAIVLSAVSAGAQTKQPSAGAQDEIVKADQALVAAFYKGDNETTISSTTTTPRQSKTAAGPTPVTPATPERPFVSTTPALYARTWDFGDAVVAIMLQPTWGGKAYWSSRVFGNHNGFWKMEESYHTTIQASPRMTAVPIPVERTSR